MKKNAFLFLWAILILGCGSTPELNVDPDLLMEYNVIVHDSFGNPICGGTVIKSTFNKTVVITAAHCVYGAIYNVLYGGDATMYIMPQDQQLYQVTVGRYEPIFTDVATLETNTDPIPIQRAASIVLQEPEECEFVWTIGLGGGEPDAFSFGIVSKIGIIDHYGRTMNQFDCTAWYGNSGGGVFNADGDLISIVSQMGPQFHDEPETGWFYGATVEHIREVLNRK